MFGTIGHARLKPGSRGQLDALMAEWNRTIRPKVPGDFVQLVGHADGAPEELVFVAPAQDQVTYRTVAAMPEQDAWFRRFAAHVAGEGRWEDVAMEVLPS